MPFLKFQAKSRYAILFLLSIFLFGTACQQRKIELKSPPGYDFSKAFPYKLDNKIREISGIVWDTNNDEFIANNDESGKLFYLDKATALIKKIVDFAGKGDYEDIAFVNGDVYVLKSDATITKVVKDSADANRMIGAELGKLELKGTNDFEAMYYDSARNALVVLCKNCDMDKGKNRVSAFAFNLDSAEFNGEPIYSIDTEHVEKLAPRETTRLEPSAAAVHPVLKKLFIVSSGSHQLVIADLNGKVEFAYVLSKKIFPQAEGITFKSGGDMYISNESISSKATLLRFSYTYKP